MSPQSRALATAAAVLVAAGAGMLAGQHGLVMFPFSGAHWAMEAPKQKAVDAVIYYRDRAGKPLYSLTPKKSADGTEYIPVYASEDVSFDGTQREAMAAERKIKFYRNPMGLPDTSPTPKKDSMGMDYIAVYEGDDTDDGTVRISPGKVQRTGVETSLVSRIPITRAIKAPGIVQLDERRISVIAPRFDGYVLSIGAATSGSNIKKGETLVTAFGQEVLDQGARLLIEQSQGGRDDDAPGLRRGKIAVGGAVGATRRLKTLGVPEAYMEQIKSEDRVPDAVELTAPYDGIVLERNIVDGQTFKPGDVLFRVADHSTVWIIADVAEGDIAAIKPGLSVSVRMRAHPNRTFSGTVALVYPLLTKETRTGRVRIEMQNTDLALLPDMYGEVEISTGSNESVLAVPSGAVIDSGTRQIVLIAREEGRYEPKDVEIGRSGDGYIEIVSGVAEGDKVVTNGNFLIDAESNLQAALKGFKNPEPEVKP